MPSHPFAGRVVEATWVHREVVALPNERQGPLKKCRLRNYSPGPTSKKVLARSEPGAAPEFLRKELPLGLGGADYRWGIPERTGGPALTPSNSAENVSGRIRHLHLHRIFRPQCGKISAKTASMVPSMSSPTTKSG
jgi:hypothetical protein